MPAGYRSKPGIRARSFLAYAEAVEFQMRRSDITNARTEPSTPHPELFRFRLAAGLADFPPQIIQRTYFVAAATVLEPRAKVPDQSDATPVRNRVNVDAGASRPERPIVEPLARVPHPDRQHRPAALRDHLEFDVHAPLAQIIKSAPANREEPLHTAGRLFDARIELEQTVIERVGEQLGQDQQNGCDARLYTAERSYQLEQEWRRVEILQLLRRQVRAHAPAAASVRARQRHDRCFLGTRSRRLRRALDDRQRHVIIRRAAGKVAGKRALHVFDTLGRGCLTQG